MRHVMFVTGTRAEYDILRSVITAVDATDGLRASVVVTGAHLAPMYGHTGDLVDADGVTVAGRLETLLNTDSRSGRVKSAAIQLSGLVDLIVAQRPDFVVAPMDREEAVTTALAGAYLGIPVVHIGGGDTAEDGNIDNSVRDAVTKLSHLHMVTTEASAERVRRLGEEPWRVHVVGAPGLDRFVAEPSIDDATLWRELGHQPSGPFAMLIQHPIISSVERSGELTETTLRALLTVGRPVIVGYPNSDAGSQRAIEVIDRYVTEHPETFHGYRNLDRRVFVNLLRRASVLVGNSSAGIIEAPLLGLPVVNIGPRQVGREHAANVLFVDHDEAAIAAAVRRAMDDDAFRASVVAGDSVYGDGTAGRRIAGILLDQAIDDRLLWKVSTF
jgi:GDP/UDP-N,N'-diacetylbacillosamine 2-epimerase (hydrolysing)